MIIVKLQGGLGNQMFQYAFGKALSLEHNSDLYVDTSFLTTYQNSYEGFTSRPYELKVFKTEIKIANSQLIRSFEKSNVLKKGLRFFGLPFKKIYHENKAGITEQIDFITPPVLLIGYWQSENYFKKYNNKVKEEFEFSKASKIAEAKMIEKIQSSNSVSVHVRRGDYVTNPVARDVLGVLDKKYYIKAMELIKARIDDPFYCFFSDDIDWVKKNFKGIQNQVVIENSMEKINCEDMYLMSQCKHNIIANSSFSWWGAWLNNNQNKIVIAPKLWNKNSLFHNPHLIPKDWLIV